MFARCIVLALIAAVVEDGVRRGMRWAVDPSRAADLEREERRRLQRGALWGLWGLGVAFFVLICLSGMECPAGGGRLRRAGRLAC